MQQDEHPGRREAQDDDQEHNELGYRNVDEEAEHDERGSQGPGSTEPPPDECERQ